MRFVDHGYGDGNGKIEDVTSGDDLAKAKRRQKLIESGATETQVAKFDPNGARGNDNPGMPCADYE